MPLTLTRPDVLCTQNFIAGQWRDARDAQRYGVEDPSSTAVIAQVPDSGMADAQDAADAAQAAFPAWRARNARERSHILKRWHAAIVSNTEDLARIISREQGPVVPLFRFSDEADVVREANDTPFGLAAYFYARDLKRIWRVAERLETGIIGINEGLIGSEAAPFGGVKESGYGREGSRHGLDDYMHTKYLCYGEIE